MYSYVEVMKVFLGHVYDFFFGFFLWKFTDKQFFEKSCFFTSTIAMIWMNLWDIIV